MVRSIMVGIVPDDKNYDEEHENQCKGRIQKGILVPEADRATRPDPLVAHKNSIPATPFITAAEEISPGFIGQ